MLIKKVGIIILNYRNFDNTIDCIDSLARISYPEVEVVIVDNHSENNSLLRICEHLRENDVAFKMIGESDIAEQSGATQRMFLLQSDSNRGYSAGNNLGIRVALSRDMDYVLLLNNDTIVTNGFLEPLVEYAESHQCLGAVGPKVLNADGDIDQTCARRRPTAISYFFRSGIGRKIFPNNWWLKRHTYQGEYDFTQPREVDVLSGCCMLIKSDVFRRLGMLDENTFLFLEEFILHERMREAGLAAAIVPSSEIVHLHGQSTSDVPSEFIREVGTESFRYYLSHYRHYNQLMTTAIILSTRSPKRALKKMWSALRF